MTQDLTRILFVEDEIGHAKLAQRGFQNWPQYEFVLAGSLAEARRHLRSTPFALVLADLLLPDGRGTDLLQDGSIEGCPFIVLTSHGDEQSAVQALKSGALDYVVKTDALLLDLPRVAQRAIREWDHIQARQSAEKALRESEARFRGIFENESECVSLHDSAGRVLDMNPAGLKMFAVESLQEIQERGFSFYMDPGAATEFDAAVRAVFAGESRQLEFQLKISDRPTRQIDSNMVPLPGPGGSPPQLLAVSRDITERHRAEERSQELWLQLAHVNRLSSMGEMASALVHEVNQPLGAIANYAGTCVHLIVTERCDNDEIEMCLEKINEQALRAGAILARLKSFIAKTTPRPVLLDLNELIRTVMQLMRSDLQSLSGGVELGLSDSLPLINGDGIQLQQVLVNVIRNAVESMESSPAEERHLTIQSQQNEMGYVEVRIEDRGSGLTTSQLDSIFEPYETSKPDGLGMGLSISRSIITAHGGRMWASTGEHSPGACFHFTLPTRQQASWKETASSMANHAGPQANPSAGGSEG